MTPDILLTPIKPSVPALRSTTLDVMLRVRVPESAPGATVKRPALNLALVIDRSGSMGGRPLEEAKAAARRIVESLTPGDRVAVIAYDQTVTTVAQSMDATHRTEIVQAIDQIRPGGMTNLHGGWLAGAEQVAQHLSKAAINRVILLSDGAQNQGIVDPEEIARQCEVMAGKGVETSTYGLGHDFNEDLMAAMARRGRGNAYYGETAEDLAPSFEAELGVLSHTTGKNVRLTARARDDAARVEMLNSYAAAGDGWLLPNLVAGAEVWAVLRLHLAQIADTKSTAQLLQVDVAYDTPEGTPARPLQAQLDLPVVTPAAFDAAQADTTVTERVRELEAARIQLDAKTAARAGNWKAVDAAVASLNDLAGDNAYVGEVARTLSELSAARDGNLLSKEATFAAASMSARYADIDEDARSLQSKSLFTRRRGRQGKHS